MSVLESKLVVSLIDRLTGPSRGIAGAMERLTAQSERNVRQLSAMRGEMLDAVGAGYALWKGLSAPVSAAVEFESAMSDIRKVVDFDTAASFRQMGDDIRKMSLNIPMAATGIAQIVAAAGQSGIAQNELAKFAEIAAKVGVAWDIGAGETGEALAKLKTALGISLDDTASLADAINHLGNNSAASAPQILDVVRRVAPMASQFGMTAEQVAAIGAAMTGAGFEAEVASTSLLNVGRALTKGESATARQVAVFKKLKLSAKGVAQSMQKDAVGTLQDVLARINKLPASVRAAAISDLFGDEARALGPLISNGDLLAQVLDLIADKSKYAGSASKEFDTASQRTAFGLQIFKNRVTDLAISVGDALLPAVNRILGRLGPMVTSISELAREYPGLTSAITATTAAIVAFRIAATAARFAGLFMMGGVINALIGLGSAAGVFTAITGALTGVGAALAAISAPVWLGIALGAAAVGAAGAVIYKYWDRITATLSGVAAAIGDQLTPVIQRLQPYLDQMAPALEAVSNAAGWVGEKFSQLGQMFSSLFDREILGADQAESISNNARNMTNRIIEQFVAGHVALYNAGVAMIQKLWDGMVSQFDAFIEWVKTIPSRIVAAVGNIDLTGSIRWPKFLGGGGDEPAVDGARASGGPVRAGGTYLVGEKGPELFSPGRSGMISPNAAYQAVARGSQSSTASRGGNTFEVSVSPVIHINGASSPQAVANHVLERIGRETQNAVESLYSDGL